MTPSDKPFLMPDVRRGRGRARTADEAMMAFIDQMGVASQKDGLPRIAGRMFAWFVLNGGPVSLPDLAAALGVSKASASTNARLLTQLGVLARTPAMHERRDFYELAPDGYARLLEGYVQRMRERLRMIDDLLPSLPESRPDVLGRVQALRRFYAEAIASNEALVRRLRAGG